MLSFKKITFLLITAGFAFRASGQQKTLWHNIPRQVRYHPDGTDFVIQNGKRRFNRAIYGTNTAFRVEAGDLPEFALYLPGMGGNFKLGLIKGDQSKWLIDAKSIEARYRPGSMIYLVKDPFLGKGSIQITVLAGASTESMIVKVRLINTGSLKLLWAYGGATGKKFSRDGDIGADPEWSFYLQPDYCLHNSFQTGKGAFILNYNARSLSEADRYEVDHTGKKLKTETVSRDQISGIFPVSSMVRLSDASEQDSPLKLWTSTAADRPVITGLLKPAGEDLYWIIKKGTCNADTVNARQWFVKAEQARSILAARVTVRTPDPYINTLGGALSIAADAIWESPSYLHGAVAWRMRLPAWRGPYAADPLGWHNRAWTHFSSYALSQVTAPDTGPVVADTALHLARQLEKLGTSMFSSGYISRNPGGDLRPNHYDMNLVYIDEMLDHFRWTGNITEIKQLWPVIKRHLAWEKRNFDRDGDGLYDAYCCIWASDALQYSGGGVTHSSAYNYRANQMAAYLAALLGEDPGPYRHEAEKILKAIQSQLWLPGRGSYAEYKDLLGRQLVHPSAGLWTIYHAIDADVPDAFQAYQSLRYVDTQIPHIPVIATGLSSNYYLLSTSNWLPYTWSVNNVAMAENLHAALAYWQGGQSANAFTLWKSALLESMYLGASPGNFQQLSFYDAQRGELYRDFADPIGMAGRSLVEGLFGIRPDALKDTLTIRPGFPVAWNYAAIHVPDIGFDFKRIGKTDTYSISTAFAKTMRLKLVLPAVTGDIQTVLINGKAGKWKPVPDAVGQPLIQIDALPQKNYTIKITWKGKKPVTIPLIEQAVTGRPFRLAGITGLQKFYDPQHVFAHSSLLASDFKGIPVTAGQHTFFIKLKQVRLAWWQPVNLNVVNAVEIQAEVEQPADLLTFKVKNNAVEGTINVIVNPELKERFEQVIPVKAGVPSVEFRIAGAHLLPGSNHIKITYQGGSIDTSLINWNITGKKILTESVDISAYFNDAVTNIFKNQYLSPRPQSPTLQLPTQGIGNWCYPLVTANIDDSGLKKAAGADGLFNLPQHVAFTVSGRQAKNIVFTSQWANYPRQVTLPLAGSASHAYLLMAGSTNPMQSRMVNGEVTITYTDGTYTMLQLKNPENWWPIEQDDDHDGFAFNTGAPVPLRVYLKEGKAACGYDHYSTIKGYTNKAIDGGAATVLDMPLDPHKQLKSLQLRTITNDVVIGLMAVSLLRN